MTYAYDKAGHIASRGGTLFQSVLPAAVTSATYDLANRLTARTAAGVTVSPTWDANGNLTGDGVQTYLWDARNRLSVIQNVAGFGYDGFGRRLGAIRGGMLTTFLYDGWEVAQEQSGSGNTDLVLGSGTDERFSRAGATYLTDALGSTSALGSSGTVQTNYGYDPYGVSQVTGTASTNTFQYTGRENDGTGLLAYRNRYYNPSWGRFISEDPIGLGGGINVYAYVHDNPINLADPSGLDPTGGSGPQDLLQLIELIAETEVVGLGPEDPIADAAVIGEILAYEDGAFSTLDTAGGLKGINTNVTADEFSANLQSNGYTATTLTGSNGPVTVLQNGQGSTYTVYTRTSTGESGAQYIGPNGQVLNYNLGR